MFARNDDGSLRYIPEVCEWRKEECKNPVYNGRSYCDEHYYRIYQKPSENEKEKIKKIVEEVKNAESTDIDNSSMEG